MKTVQRILVALDDSPQSRAALYEAAKLAARLHADLDGVFVLDTELLRLGELPIACETEMISSTRRSIDTRTMERALQRQAQRLQASLAQTARQHQVRSTFRLSRGNVATEVLAAAAGADLLALGRQGQTAIMSRRPGSTLRRILAEADCSLLFPNRGNGVGDSVVVLFDGTDATRASLSYARHVAGHRDMGLAVLLCGAAENVEALRGEALEALSTAPGEPPPAITFHAVAPGNLRALPQLVSGLGAGLLVLPRTSALADDRDDLLRNVGCPVLLTA
jgi:nucleotide-binding universal stress UspA family protein